MAVARSRPINEGAPAGNAADCGWARHSQRRDPLPDARRAEDGMLFRVFLSLEDLRRLVGRAMEQDETAAIVREIAGSAFTPLTDARRTQRVSAGG